jgi:hypothetical protein
MAGTFIREEELYLSRSSLSVGGLLEIKML